MTHDSHESAGLRVPRALFTSILKCLALKRIFIILQRHSWVVEVTKKVRASILFDK